MGVDAGLAPVQADTFPTIVVRAAPGFPRHQCTSASTKTSANTMIL